MQYFHIEGLDLAGKTTATKAIVRLLGDNVQIRRNSLKQNNRFHEIVDNIRIKNLIEEKDLGWLYLKVLEDDINHFIEPCVNTIQDSTIFLRSLAYHTAKGNNKLVNEMLKLVDRHPQFTKSLVLTASIEVRQQRLKQRQQENPEEVAEDDLLVIKKPDLFLRMEQNLVNYTTTFFNSVVIDTTNLSKEEVAQAVVEIITKK
jgi:thymidylate kinase